MYKYECDNCGGKVEKVPLVKGGTGLGTWKCVSGCPKRHFTVTRRIDSGKEAERSGMYDSIPVRRPIKVKRRLNGKQKED